MPSPPGAVTSGAGVVGDDTPVRLVPVRARDVVLRELLDRFAVRRVVPLAPVRRVLLVLLAVVARAPVRPELLRRLVLRRAVLRPDVLRRFALPRLVVL